MGSHGFDIGEYISAKLAEVEEALAELDARPDVVGRDEERQQLVEFQAQLLSTLATWSQAETQTTLN